MKRDWMVRVLLLMIALPLAVLAIRPVVQPPPVSAQAGEQYPYYVEPGYTMIRKPDGTAQMYGKIVIDMRTGDVWGFPTLTQSPYPVDTATTTPPKSHPIYLGRFLFSEMKK